MFSLEQYELLDIGDGRRLERFGALLLDRFCSVAMGFHKNEPKIWKNADALFVMDGKNDSERGFWQGKTEFGKRVFGEKDQILSQNSSPWTISHHNVTFELCGTPFGHIGVFPEQAENWDKIFRFCQTADSKPLMKVLNLFAYTGGSTLAAAAAGADVTHVDSAKSVVLWGRRNAECSQLENSPIHWLVEDAHKFVKRELKRGNSYQGIILDPPSYGHGTMGEVWQLSKQLPELLADCFSLLHPQNEQCFLLLTCHTPNYSLHRLAELVTQKAETNFFTRHRKFKENSSLFEKKTLSLHSRSGRILPAGESVLFCYNLDFKKEGKDDE